MKKTLFVGIIGIIMTIAFILAACGQDYSGEYVGYAWKDEAKGVALQDATEKIETKITLDARGTITAVYTKINLRGLSHTYLYLRG